MNLKLIALAAMLAAGSAQAKIADSSETGRTSGDMFASIVSASQTATYTVDLGLSIDQFNIAAVNAAGVKLVWDFDNNSFTDMSAVSTGLATQSLNYGSVWSSFATAGVLSAADLKFDVKAMDGAPTTVLSGSGQNRYLSTSQAATIGANNTTIFNMDVGMDVYLGAVNGDTTNSTHGSDLNIAGASKYDSALGDNFNAHFENGSFDNWKGQTTFSSVGSVNSPLNFYFLSNSSHVGASAATVTAFAGKWTFDETTAQLTYATAPVPEAETYAMMLAGLGLVGFMVSRRNKRA